MLRKEITFEKASPVIKICLTRDNGELSTQDQKTRKHGRKRSAAKLEDAELVKKIKAGENVERNERQIKQLEDMNKGGSEHVPFLFEGNEGRLLRTLKEQVFITFLSFYFVTVLEELNSSKAVNEYTILCGRCKKQKIVPTDRAPKAKAEYFKKSL